MDYRIKILAIDDHPDNLVSLKAIIGDIFPDAQFIKAENGITGIKSARLHDPDVILLDINMPDLDGFEVCRKIKSDHLLSDIPVVFVTAYATDKKIRIKALESGAEAFISKPLDEIELTAQITAMLKIKQANILKRNEKEQLADLVKVKTQKLIDELAERRLINEKLKQSEERYRTTLDNMLEGCQIIGSDWCYIYLNSTAELHNRRPKTEMLGHTYMEIWPGIEDTEVFKHIRNCMENRVFKQIENEFYYLDGSSGWFDLSIQPVPEGIFILSIDITDRKKAIKELQQSFDLRNNLTAMVPGVVYQYRLYPDGHSCFPYASPGMWDMYECTPEEVREDASLVFTRIHTDDFDSIVKSINESARNQTVYHSEFRVILPEQGLRWRLCNAKPQILEDGSTIWFGTVSDITESKIAEERLKENLTLLRIAGEYAKLGGWIVMLDDNRSYWSDEVALIHEMPLGYSPTVEDGIKFYAPEWRNKITKVFTDCSRKGIPYDEEMEIITATGKRVWIRTIGEAVKDENGKIYKVQGAFQDISERKQADEKLRLSEEKLKNVFEHSITGKSITEINGKISVNNAFCKMLGYSKSELSEIKWQQITHPDDIQQDQANINLMITGKEASMRWEKRYISKDKKIIWVDLGTILQRDQDGKPLYFITSVNDITERKNTEVALLKSESQLKEAQRIAHIGSWELDVVNNILSWSDEIYRIFEIDQKSFKASYEAFLNAIHPEDRDAVNLAFTNSLKNKSPYKIEHRLLFPDGRIKYVLEQCETMYNNENRPVISIGTVQDITIQKNADEALRKSEERYRKAQEVGHVGSWEYDIQKNTFWGSEEGKRIYGFDPEKDNFTFEEVMNCVHNSEVVNQSMIDLIENDKPYNIVFEITPKNSLAKKTINSIAELLRDETGKPLIASGVLQDITERKKAEDELQQQKLLLNTIIESAIEAIFAKDADGYYRSINKAGAKVFGISQNEVIGKTDYDLVSESTAYEFRKTDIYVMASGEIYEREETGMIEGKIRTFLAHKAPWLDSTGKIKGVIGISYDITDRKLAQDKIQKIGQHYQALIEKAPDGIALIDAKGEFKFISTSAKKIFGYDSSDTFNGHPNDITHPDDLPFVLMNLEKLLREPSFVPIIRYRIINKLQEWIWIESTFSNLLNEPSVEAIVINFRDITENKQSELRLRRLNRTYALLSEINLTILRAQNIEETFESACRIAVEKGGFMMAWIGIHDPVSNKIIPVASAGNTGDYLKKLEISIDDTERGNGPTAVALREGDHVVVNDISIDTRMNPWRQDALNQGYRSSAAFPLNLNGLLWGTFNLYASEIEFFDEDELKLLDELAANISFYMEFNEEEIQRKKAEKSLRETNETLDQRVMQRTEQLEAANKELEAFTYSVSHDLRAPLRGIHGFTQILLEEYSSKLDPEGIRVCGIIKENALKMGQLIDDLLTFSRLGRTNMQVSEIDMKNMAESIYYEITNEESRKRIELNIGNLCYIMADTNLIRQVWTNLFSNAVKFSSKKEKSIITVSCKNENEKCVYCIKDNGAGFDMNYANKLFGVFQRLHSANDFEGTGVGLAIVQRIIHRHGGQVWAEGEVENGASFYFSLPVQLLINK